MLLLDPWKSFQICSDLESHLAGRKKILGSLTTWQWSAGTLVWSHPQSHIWVFMSKGSNEYGLKSAVNIWEHNHMPCRGLATLGTHTHHRAHLARPTPGTSSTGSSSGASKERLPLLLCLDGELQMELSLANLSTTIYNMGKWRGLKCHEGPTAGRFSPRPPAMCPGIEIWGLLRKNHCASDQDPAADIPDRIGHQG